VAERGLTPGWRHSRVAPMVAATDEETMVRQHAPALLRANLRGGLQAPEWLETFDAHAPTHNE